MKRSWTWRGARGDSEVVCGGGLSPEVLWEHVTLRGIDTQRGFQLGNDRRRKIYGYSLGLCQCFNDENPYLLAEILSRFHFATEQYHKRYHRLLFVASTHTCKHTHDKCPFSFRVPSARPHEALPMRLWHIGLGALLLS